MEKLGMRQVVAGAMLLIAVAIGLTTQMRFVWQLQMLWGLAVGVGVGSMAGWIAATVSNRWFARRRGLVVGVLTAAGATGQLIFLPLLASMVENYGWRAAVLFVAVVALAVIPLVLVFIRDRPEDVGLLPYGMVVTATAIPASVPAESNPFAAAMKTLRQCVRNRDFLLLAGSFFICGASTNGLIGTHLIPASVEHGMSDVTAASFLAVIGVFDIAGTTVSGWLSDRFDNRWLLFWYYGLRGLSLMFLPYAFEAGFLSLAVFVIFYGLDWVATVPPTVRLTSDIFGKGRASTVYAWIFASHQLGAATIAFVAGALRAWLGDYQVAFISAGLLCLVAVAMVISIGRLARGERLASGAL
jgi:sugar phosphate permease